MIVEVQLLCMTDSTPQSLSDLPQTSCECVPIVLHMLKKFEVNQTKIKGGCQSCRKAATYDSWSDLTLIKNYDMYSSMPNKRTVRSYYFSKKILPVRAY